MSADAPSSSVRAVAVVTRTIGRPLLLRRARMSVAAQRFRDLVWVVVNDGGDPRAVEDEITAARAAGLDAAVLHRETRGGMESAANLGIRASQSRYVAIHDDDDSWQPGFLAATVAALDSDAGFVGAVTRCVTVIEEIDGERILTLDRRPQNPWLRALHLADLAVRNLYPPIAFLYRREAYERVGGYDESLPVLGDWDFNLKLALAGEIRVIPETLAHYHVRVGGGPDYANTITAQQDLHLRQDAEFRNRWLRADLAAGSFGLGWALMSARLQQQASRPPPLFVPRRHRAAISRARAALGDLAARLAGRPRGKS